MVYGIWTEEDLERLRAQQEAEQPEYSQACRVCKYKLIGGWCSQCDRDMVLNNGEE